MIYWVRVSKRYEKLWKPQNKYDFYDYIFKSKEDAELDIYPYYKVIPVKLVKLK